MPLNRIRSAPQSVDRTPPPSRHERASPVCIGIRITTYNFAIVNSSILAQCLNVIFCPVVLHNVEYYKNNKWYESNLAWHTFCKAQSICYNKMQKLFILPHTSVVCIWNQKLMNRLEYWFIFAFNLAFIFWLAYISQKYIFADTDILIPTSELIIYHSAALIRIYCYDM